MESLENGCLILSAIFLSVQDDLFSGAPWLSEEDLDVFSDFSAQVTIVSLTRF